MLGSCGRSAEDAALFIARRRLSTDDGGAHLKYGQIECARIVERLRAIRDVYREHLQTLGCRPLGQMYWVVFRFGVVDWAVRLLRSAVQNYVVLAAVRRNDWEVLFGPLTPLPFGEPEQIAYDEERLRPGPELEASISLRIKRDCFEEIVTGGPLGRDAQLSLAREMAGPAMMRGETFPEILARRQQSWDSCSLWTERLAWFFDAVQEELIDQANALPAEGRRAEELFPHLRPFEQIVYKHLASLRNTAEGSPRLGKQGWLALVRDLDQHGVLLDAELHPIAREVLTSIRRKGKKIGTWEAAYVTQTGTTLEDGKRRSMRSELRTCIHNAVKRVERRLAEVPH